MAEQASFGQWLKRQRLGRGLTQAELADRVGCAVVTLRKLEVDALRPSRQIATRLFAQLGISALEHSELLGVGHSELAARRHNLPTPLTALLGRTPEVEAACASLRSGTRLLTLVGPGGIGKSRLAIQVASTLLSDLRDGCFFVDLTQVRDASMVLPAIANALNVREQPSRPLIELLLHALRDKQALLLLDNFEHVLAAAPHIATLLRTLPELVVLVTSRSMLRLSVEHIFSVAPLMLPALDDIGGSAADVDLLAACPSVALFVARARAAVPGFKLTAANAAPVAAICRRLDGLPLAIELAAVRIQLFSPQALLERLEQRLNLLTEGARNFPERHQTLRATLDWSYALLKPGERILFQRLAIFMGGCTLAAAEAVCGEPNQPAKANGPKLVAATFLNGIATLFDHSMLIQHEGSDGEPRFAMLETIREYALSQLMQSGDMPALLARHSAYYLELAETADAQVEGADQARWLRCLEAEHENMRAALSWNLTAEGDAQLALRLAGALTLFWQICGYVSQGRVWLQEALDAVPEPNAERAYALYGAGMLARFANAHQEALELLASSLELCRHLGERRRAGYVLELIGFIALDQSNYAEGQARCSESLAIARELGDTTMAGWALMSLGHVAWWTKEYASATSLYEESLAAFRTSGGPYGIALALWNVVRIAKYQYDYARAWALAEESLALLTDLGDSHGMAVSIYELAQIAQAQGEDERALELCAEAKVLFRRLDDQRYIAWVLRVEGLVAEGRGEIAPARSFYQESKRLCELLDDRVAMLWPIFRLAMLALREQDSASAHQLLDFYAAQARELGLHQEAALGACMRDAVSASEEADRAVALLQHALHKFRAREDQWGMAVALRMLSWVLMEKGADAWALLCLQEGLALAQQIDDRPCLLIQLADIAGMGLRAGELPAALRLLGAAEMLQKSLGSGTFMAALVPSEQLRYWQAHQYAHEQAADPELAAAWEAGRQLAVDEAVAEALRLAASLDGDALPRRASEHMARAEWRAGLPKVPPSLPAPDVASAPSLAPPPPAYLAPRVVEMVRSQSGRLEHLNENLLAYARFGHVALMLAPVDMTQLVSQVCADLLRRDAQLHPQVEIDALPPAVGDPELLRLVWEHLLSNALKFSSTQAQARIRVRGEQSGSAIIYHVQDNGMGFDMRTVDRLFSLFQSLHRDDRLRGAGVGLAIVQRIVQRHGGRAWAEGALGQGATFSFMLPLRDTHTPLVTTV